MEKNCTSWNRRKTFSTWARVIVRYQALRARRNAARDRLVLSEEKLDLLWSVSVPASPRSPNITAPEFQKAFKDG